MLASRIGYGQHHDLLPRGMSYDTADGLDTAVSATTSPQKIRTATCGVKCPHFFTPPIWCPPHMATTSQSSSRPPGSSSLLVIQVHGSKIATSEERVANRKIPHSIGFSGRPIGLEC